MKDAFGVDIAEGLVGLHFWPVGGRSLVAKVRITGFTPKRVRYENVVTGETGTAIPEQFAILPAAVLGIED